MQAACGSEALVMGCHLVTPVLSPDPKYEVMIKNITFKNMGTDKIIERMDSTTAQ